VQPPVVRPVLVKPQVQPPVIVEQPIVSPAPAPVVAPAPAPVAVPVPAPVAVPVPVPAPPPSPPVASSEEQAVKVAVHKVVMERDGKQQSAAALRAKKLQAAQAAAETKQKLAAKMVQQQQKARQQAQVAAKAEAKGKLQAKQNAKQLEANVATAAEKALEQQAHATTPTTAPPVSGSTAAGNGSVIKPAMEEKLIKSAIQKVLRKKSVQQRIAAAEKIAVEKAAPYGPAEERSEKRAGKAARLAVRTQAEQSHKAEKHRKGHERTVKAQEGAAKKLAENRSKESTAKAASEQKKKLAYIKAQEAIHQELAAKNRAARTEEAAGRARIQAEISAKKVTYRIEIKKAVAAKRKEEATKVQLKAQEMKDNILRTGSWTSAAAKEKHKAAQVTALAADNLTKSGKAVSSSAKKSAFSSPLVLAEVAASDHGAKDKDPTKVEKPSAPIGTEELSELSRSMMMQFHVASKEEEGNRKELSTSLEEDGLDYESFEDMDGKEDEKAAWEDIAPEDHPKPKSLWSRFSFSEDDKALDDDSDHADDTEAD